MSNRKPESPEPSTPKGQPCFLVLEGLDGSGKTTVGELLAAKLARSQQRPAIALATPMPPHSSIEGEPRNWSSMEARFLFYASSIYEASSALRSQLGEATVVCDRWMASTIAYHAALGVDTSILTLRDADILEPDFQFWLRVRSEKERQRRIASRSNNTPWDQTILTSAELRNRVRREFERCDLIEIETLARKPQDVADAIVAQIESHTIRSD